MGGRDSRDGDSEEVGWMVKSTRARSLSNDRREGERTSLAAQSARATVPLTSLRLSMSMIARPCMASMQTCGGVVAEYKPMASFLKDFNEKRGSRRRSRCLEESHSTLSSVKWQKEPTCWSLPRAVDRVK